MKMRTLILDDNPLAREHLRSVLANEQDAHLIDDAVEGEAPVDVIHRQKPDLVFLDVDTCGRDGLEILRTIDLQPPPLIIVVAASAQHALAAFEARALDYLLKPVEEERVKRAFQRASDRRDAAAGGKVSQRQMRLLEDIESSPQYLTRVKVKSADRIVFLPVDQIHWVEAADNYVILHAGRQTHILREKISALEAALDPERFFRISRSRLVNIAHISELRATFKGEHIVVLNDGSRLQMTRGIEELERLVAFC